MGTIGNDIRVGWRMLAKRPALTVLTVLILALGIGANSAIWSVLSGVLLKPLPYPDADRLVQVWNTYPLMDLPRASVSIPDYLDRRREVEAFEESALFSFQSFNIAAEGPPERVVGSRATASLFPLLQTGARFGRVFTEEEDQPGGENVVVLSWGLFERKFGADPKIVGTQIRLNGESHLVLGVMPPEFTFPSPRIQLWKPIAFTAEQRSDDSRGNEFAMMTARLRPGATVELAQQQVDAIHEANKERFPEVKAFWEASGFGGRVVDYREELFGDVRPTLLLLQAVVGFVLLIACANVANLLLIRLHARQKELAVRTALGAGRARLMRQLLVESVMVALLGGAVGIWLAFLGTDLLGWLGVGDAAGLAIAPRLDGGVLLFTLGLSLATGVVFGLLPAFGMRRSDPIEVLKEGGNRGTSGDRKAALPRNVLVVAEVAIAVVLLWGAGLLVKTLDALQNEDPGFDANGVVTAQVALPTARYGQPGQIAGFWEAALERLRALPGVESVGLVSQAPFSGSSSSGSYSIEGYTPGEGEPAPHAFIRAIDEDYLQTLGIALLQGRGFERSDDLDAERVVIVDRTLVDKYWPDQNPLGQRLLRGEPDEPPYTVIGVVEPVKIRDLSEPVTKETLYVSFRQRPLNSMTLVAKTTLDPEAMTGPLRDAILGIDPEQPIYNVTTLETELAGTLQQQRVSTSMLVAFGALALVMAAVGLYGVLSFATAQRTREIGLRMALGARVRDVLELVLGQGLALAAIGVGTGVLLTFALGRLLAAQLYGVQPWDPATLVGTAAVLLGVSFIACFWPARRAARVDPMSALHEE